VLGGLLLVFIGLILIWCFSGGSYEAQILPDGSLLTIHHLQYGRQIEVVDGSAVMHWLRSLIPKGGLHIGPLSMRPPSAQVLGTPGGDEFLFLELDTISKNGVISMLATLRPMEIIVGLSSVKMGLLIPSGLETQIEVVVGILGCFCVTFFRDQVNN
jgi:hypothetical protein